MSDEFVKPSEATARMADSNERPVGLVEIAGRVKWFDAAKGYGFVDPKPGDSMLARFGPGPKGLMAAEVRPLDSSKVFAAH